MVYSPPTLTQQIPRRASGRSRENKIQALIRESNHWLVFDDFKAKFRIRRQVMHNFEGRDLPQAADTRLDLPVQPVACCSLARHRTFLAHFFPSNTGPRTIVYRTREIVASFLNAAEEAIAQALKAGTLIEVQHGSENKKDKGKDR
jgi:hypothetical protein